MNKLKVFQIGCGKMSKYIMRYVYEKNSAIVGAVDINEELIGKDIGTVMETDLKNITINHVSNLEKLLIETKPDIAIITTQSTLNDIEDVARISLKAGVNVITTCEEAFYPANSNPVLFNELDILAKANNVTITGCGYQDIFWGSMICDIASSSHKITKIKGLSSYNVEDYGIALAKAHKVSLTKEEFAKELEYENNMSEEERNKKMKEKEFFPSYMWNVVGWLADKLNLHITSIKQICTPILTEESLYSKTLNMTLEENMVRGMNATVKATTKENILFEVECIGKVYTKDEIDINEWTIYGEPTTTVKNEKPDTVKLTCADIVNRLNDVVKSKPGFIPTSQMDTVKYIVDQK